MVFLGMKDDPSVSQSAAHILIDKNGNFPPKTSVQLKFKPDVSLSPLWKTNGLRLRVKGLGFV